jgi:ketosteroid isomerase-like protein
MRRVLIVAALLLVTPTAPRAQTQGTRGGAEQDVLRAHDQVLDAIGRADTAALERLYADDYTITGPGGGVASKAERLAALKASPNTAQPPEEVKVRVYGDAAVVTGRLTGTVPGQGSPAAMRYIQVWVKRGGQWQLVASQLTRIAQQQP